MIDKLKDIVLSFKERQNYREEIYGDELSKLRKLSLEALASNDEEKLVGAFLENFWAFCGYEGLTDPEDNCYISPALFKKLKEKSSEIFHYLLKDSGVMEKAILKEKYEFLVETMWDDLSFLLWGVREKDEDDDRFYGYPVPHWIKKNMSYEDKEQLKKCSLNMLSWGESKNEMLYYLYELIGEKEL
ncbi:MAG: hypothetical protein PHW96_03205 [Candidatus Nanoarchaeia archaeon]|nr:hypothetical protein [Candidatus Nanoarchaeia archaeon]